MSGYQRKPSAPLWHLCPTDQLSNGTPRHGAAAPDAEPGALRSGYGPSCSRVEGELGSVRRCKGAEWRQDRKSTRMNPVTNAHLVCRLLLAKNKKKNQ